MRQLDTKEFAAEVMRIVSGVRERMPLLRDHRLV